MKNIPVITSIFLSSIMLQVSASFLFCDNFVTRNDGVGFTITDWQGTTKTYMQNLRVEATEVPLRKQTPPGTTFWFNHPLALRVGGSVDFWYHSCELPLYSGPAFAPFFFDRCARFSTEKQKRFTLVNADKLYIITINEYERQSGDHVVPLLVQFSFRCRKPKKSDLSNSAWTSQLSLTELTFLRGQLDPPTGSIPVGSSWFDSGELRNRKRNKG